MKKFKHSPYYITSLMVLYFLFLYHSSHSQYISSTVEQVSISTIAPGSLNNPLIRIKIEVGQNPITLYALFMTTNGSSNPGTDIDSVKVFYTDSSNIFTASVQYGTTVSHPNSGFTIGNGNMFSISSGTNYFWVVYDINDSAIVCDSIDATCYSVYMSMGTATPVVTDPPGNAIIGLCPTGINEMNIQLVDWLGIYPNPCSDFISLQKKSELVNLSVKLFDITGKPVLEKINSEHDNFQIPVGNLEAGMYLIIISDNKKIFKEKIIVQHN